jgi:hypothetical protein
MMTKHIGYQPGDFHFEQMHRRTGFAVKILPRLFDFCMPVAIGLLALYVGRYGIGG